MKQRMEAQLMFDDAHARDRAAIELAKLGYETERLPWEDRHEGVFLSTTTWLQVHGPYEGSDNEFFYEMAAIAERFGGDCCEVGFADPQPQQ